MTEHDLKDVYRQSVLSHSREPHNFGALETSDLQATGFNPLCGDKISVFMQTSGDRLERVNFVGTGCAISLASASMMTEALRGADAATAGELINTVEAMFATAATPDEPRLDEVRALAGVRAYPSRIKCATLAWKAARAALDGGTNTQHEVTTE